MMLASTTESLGLDLEIVETLGMVSGNATEGVDIISEMWARVRNVVGGKVGSVDESMDLAEERAWRLMVKEAEKLGADAIVGVDMETGVFPFRGGLMVYRAFIGTAVKVRRGR